MDQDRGPSDRAGDTRVLTRRRALIGASGVAIASLAGCLGLGGGGSASADSDLPTYNASGSLSASQPLDAPVKGDPNANVTVAAYEDYACPHCQEYVENVVPEIQSNYIDSNDIRYEHHDFPIPVDDPASYTAANAARAAQALAGDEAFWTYLDQLFANQDSLGPDFYSSLGEETGLGADRIKKAATNRQFEQTITNDRQQGVNKGVDATPTVFVNGTAVDPTVDAISSAIDSAQ